MWEHTAISRYKYVGRTDKECSGWCHEIETYPEVDIFPMDKRPFISRRESTEQRSRVRTNSITFNVRWLLLTKGY